MEYDANGYLKYSPNYDIDIVEREDILSTVADSTKEWYRIDDIVRNIETTAKRAIQEDLTCHIPYLGTFTHNFKKCYTENKEEILKAKATLDPVEFIIVKKKILREAVVKEKTARRFKAVLPAAINKNKEYYKFLCSIYPKWQADACMVLTPENYTPPIGYNIENEKIQPAPLT
jgi:hypothetical protein